MKQAMNQRINQSIKQTNKQASKQTNNEANKQSKWAIRARARTHISISVPSYNTGLHRASNPRARREQEEAGAHDNNP